MSDTPEQQAETEAPEEAAEPQPAPEAAEAEPDAPEAADVDAPETEAEDAVSADERLVQIEAELAEMRDQLLRAVAETENVRRRAQREKEDAGKYAIASFAREMLSVSDNLGRALDSGQADGESGEADSAALQERFDNFVLGVRMTETEMQKTFERIGISKIEPEGQPFDPKLHHAMFEIEDAEKPSGTVMHVIEAGYVLHDRLLREAKVGVSKGGPKARAEDAVRESDPGEAEGAAQAYEQSPETGSKVDQKL